MSVLRFLRRWAGVMDQQSAEAWAGARTLGDLGQMTARWLEGDLPSQPAYAPGFGPDEETRDLIPALAAANRAGLLTNQSQPGCDAPGYDGAWWQQHAAVSGFTDDTGHSRLREAVEGTGLLLTAGRAHPRRTSYSAAVDGMFGTVLSARDIRRMYSACDAAAVETLVAAWQVTIQDPEYGESTRLWEALDRFSGRAPARRPAAVATPSPMPMDSPGPGPAARPTAASVDTRAALETLRDGISALTRDAWSVADRLQAEGVGGTTAAAAVSCAEALALALEETADAQDRAHVEVG